MEEKRKFDLYVHGNIISKGYCAAWKMEDGAHIEQHVAYEDVDTKHGIIVEGDMTVDNLYTMNRSIGASGFICGRTTKRNI